MDSDSQRSKNYIKKEFGKRRYKTVNSMDKYKKMYNA